MPHIIQNRRRTGYRLGTAHSFPHIDTPNMSYATWLQASGKRLGTVTDSPRVAVIGAGPGGLAATYELLRCGADVTLFEAADRYGGRAYSYPLGPKINGVQNFAELGCMRFPPSEESLFHYIHQFIDQGFDIRVEDDFPDPGTVPTLVTYKGEAQMWTNTESTPAPRGFEHVSTGWNAFMKNGFSNGILNLVAPETINQWLFSGDADLREKAARAWQVFIDEFKDRSFYQGLVTILGGPNGPKDDDGNEIVWRYPEDFEKFGALGTGAGGFEPFYSICFLDIMRLFVDGLETDQQFIPTGIDSVMAGFAKGVITRPDGSDTTVEANLQLNSAVTAISGCPETGFTLTVEGEPVGPFERVIVATTTRVMEVNLDLTAPCGLVSTDSAAAIRLLHLAESSKIYVLVPEKYWKQDCDIAQDAVGDTMFDALYALGYDEDPKTPGVVLLSYSWGDQSEKQEALDKPERLARMIQDVAHADPRLAELIRPYQDDLENVVQIDWQTDPLFRGAFKLNLPGQDMLVQTVFYDFLKAGGSEDTGVYLAGDSVSWIGGWVEGALQTGLNAVAGVVKSLGGTLTDEPTSPFARLNPEQYDYSAQPGKE